MRNGENNGHEDIRAYKEPPGARGLRYVCVGAGSYCHRRISKRLTVKKRNKPVVDRKNATWFTSTMPRTKSKKCVRIDRC